MLTERIPNRYRVYGREGIAPTLDNMQGGGREPHIIDSPKCIGGFGEKRSNGGTQWYQQDRVYQSDIALCLPSNLPGGSYWYQFDESDSKD